jgi:hypothetical protein
MNCRTQVRRDARCSKPASATGTSEREPESRTRPYLTERAQAERPSQSASCDDRHEEGGNIENALHHNPSSGTHVYRNQREQAMDTAASQTLPSIIVLTIIGAFFWACTLAFSFLSASKRSI